MIPLFALPTWLFAIIGENLAFERDQPGLQHFRAISLRLADNLLSCENYVALFSAWW
ncbi:hypothetical protein OH492_15170 [Vibrio chagasii]|nr:hypothetical protein [Vibrio chagasii]